MSELLTLSLRLSFPAEEAHFVRLCPRFGEGWEVDELSLLVQLLVSRNRSGKDWSEEAGVDKLQCQSLDAGSCTSSTRLRQKRFIMRQTFGLLDAGCGLTSMK